jgi:hypothetical protein
MTSRMELDIFRVEDNAVRIRHKRIGTQDECFARR